MHFLKTVVFATIMTFIDFVKSQWANIPLPTTSFEGQTVIVTGSNVGLGREAARHFGRLGATKVILAVRSVPMGEAAAKSIHESIGKEGVCEVWRVDMGKWDSIKEFVKRTEQLDRLDVVVENAGIAKTEFTQMEGIESTIAVNVVGTFLMALKLPPILREKAKKNETTPKLVIVGSGAHMSVSACCRPDIFEITEDPCIGEIRRAA